jgi:hypothetical protein
VVLDSYPWGGNTVSGHTDTVSVDSEEVVDDLDEAAEVIDFTYSITAYGADYPVDSLVKRISAGDIIVPRFSWEPDEQSEVVGFQREYVWQRPRADRFIESLLLGLPVPGIFLVKEQSGRFLVLDGHQRLFTLHAFYDGTINGQEYGLGNVQERFTGMKYSDLPVEDRRRLDDSIIHATVIRQDEPTEDQSSIYMIFERLNTGGINLRPQEIRVALYHGEFVRVLRKLNDYPSWRQLYGKKSRRLKDMELILRFLAFFYYAAKYRSPMKDFLNRYMASNRDLHRQSEEELTGTFQAATDLLMEAIGHRVFRPERAINAAVVDSVLTGAARRLCRGPVKNHARLVTNYEKLMKNKDYRAAVERGTSNELNVKTRIELATEAFATVK